MCDVSRLIHVPSAFKPSDRRSDGLCWFVICSRIAWILWSTVRLGFKPPDLRFDGPCFTVTLFFFFSVYIMFFFNLWISDPVAVMISSGIRFGLLDSSNDPDLPSLSPFVFY